MRSSGILEYLLTIFTIAVLFPGDGRCDVVLKGRLVNAAGVRWAAQKLSEAARVDRVHLPRVVAELAAEDLKVGDGYVIESANPHAQDSPLRLWANSEGAIIYALLDLRDRIRFGSSVPTKLKFTPALRLRGTAEVFPFWIETTMYSGFWRMFENSEKDPKCWWRDRAGWTRRFREAAERRVNCIVLNHPHPYPALLEYDKYPEAQVYDRTWAHQNVEDFRWIVREGRKYGVSIYFLTWNIVVPPSFAKAHGVEEFGSQAQVVKDYTRYCVKKLFDTYPELGGLITMGAETPVGCTDWVIENVVSALNQCNPKPNLIWWGWCTYPEDSFKVKQAYRGRTEVMHYLQYEQYFKPIADPRIGRWSRETGGTKMIAIGGPKSAHCYYTWGDPEWARETVRSLKEDNNGSGLILETWMSATWLAREAFCRYMWDLADSGNPLNAHLSTLNEWHYRLAERYSPEVAAGLLDCYAAASRIIPRFLCLVHSQSDHFQPQLGLPLVYYLAMPSLSTYVFEWYDGVNRRGRLIPNYGLTWPNPDWGEKVLPIDQYAYWVARGKSTFSSTTPPQIADEIEASSQRCLELLSKLEGCKPKAGAQDYAYTLRILRMNAYWGMQTACKIRAAMAWALFKETGGADQADLCVRHLKTSLDWYRKLAELASQIYPDRMHFYLSFLSSMPPWKQNDIWFSYLPTKQHWRDMVPRYERELALVAEQLKLGSKAEALPLPDQLWQEQEERTAALYDFEKEEKGLILDKAAGSTTEPFHVISGTRSLICDTRGQPGEWHTCLRTFPGNPPLKRGKRYQVRLKYGVVNNPNTFSQPFALGARSDTGGAARDIGTFRTWSAPTGTTSEHVIQIEPQDYDDYYVFFLVRGPAAVAVDDLSIAEVAN